MQIPVSNNFKGYTPLGKKSLKPKNKISETFLAGQSFESHVAMYKILFLSYK